MGTAAKQCRVNVRTTKQEKATIQAGAALEGKNLSEFMVSSAYEKAQLVMAEQRSFQLSPKQWDAFVEALDRPVRRNARLEKLLSEPTILES